MLCFGTLRYGMGQYGEVDRFTVCIFCVFSVLFLLFPLLYAPEFPLLDDKVKFDLRFCVRWYAMV